MESLIAKDSEALKSIMTPSLLNQEGLDDEVDEFLNFIDGDIINHSEPKGHISSWKKRDNKIIQRLMSGYINSIETSTGKHYSVHHFSMDIYDKAPGEQGVYCITMVNTDQYDSDKGYPSGARVTIGKKLNAYYNELDQEEIRMMEEGEYNYEG